MNVKNPREKIINPKKDLDEAVSTLEAIRKGEVDAFVVSGVKGEKVYTLESADYAYRIFLEQMNEGAMMLGYEGTILYANKAFINILKTPPKKLVGGSIFDFINAQHIKKFGVILRKSEDKTQIAEVEFNKRIPPFRISLVPIKKTYGIPVISMIATNLEDKKVKNRIKKELKNTELISEFTKKLLRDISKNRLSEIVAKEVATVIKKGVVAVFFYNSKESKYTLEKVYKKNKNVTDAKKISFKDGYALEIVGDKSIFKRENELKRIRPKEYDKFFANTESVKKLKKKHKIENIFVIPLTVENEKLGCLFIFSKTNDKKIENEELITTIANEASTALRRIILEDDLKKIRKSYLNLIHHAPAAIYEVDFRKQKLTSVNDAMTEITGYSRQELLTMDPFELLDDEGKGIFQKRMVDWLKGKKSQKSVEYKVRKKDGKYIYAVLDVTFTTDKNGKPFGATVIAHNITDQKVANQKLLKERERLKLAQKYAGLGIWDWDMKTDKINWSNQLFNLFGLDAKNDIPSFSLWNKIIHPEDKNLAENRISDAAKNKKILDSEYRIILPSKEIRWIHALGDTQYDKNGRALRMIGVCMDITNRKRLENQKDEFINIASHELKTPLTSIKAFTQILAGRFSKSSDKTTYKLLRRVEQQVDKLTNLVVTLLDVSKIESGRIVYMKDRFNLDKLVKESVNDIKTTVGNNYEIEIEGKTNCVIIADRFRISQVVSNLLINAIKYSPNSEKIIVKLGKRDKELRVSVQDFGIGISKEKQKKLFTKFYRITGEQRQIWGFSNMGLGLYISSEIIRRHGGKIGIESKLGKGSTFYFTLPLKK